MIFEVLVTFIFPWLAAPVPNSAPKEVPVSGSSLYARAKIPTDCFPPTLMSPSFLTSEPFTAYTPTAPLFATVSFSTEIIPLFSNCP